MRIYQGFNNILTTFLTSDGKYTAIYAMKKKKAAIYVYKMTTRMERIKRLINFHILKMKSVKNIYITMRIKPQLCIYTH